MFAGVGGFRCGLNHIKEIADASKPEKWRTVWFNQWEPKDKSIQWAHSCYVNRFGTRKELDGNDTTGKDIHSIEKTTIPDHNLLVGGFPCQDYSVAASLSTSKGLEGPKGILWWDIRDTLEAKSTPFVLLENVDRLIKSPSKQRGRDFAVILACLRDLGYSVEWRVINAADYGYQQRRKRTFIFAYRNETAYSKRIAADVLSESCIKGLIENSGFFATCFPVSIPEDALLNKVDFSKCIGDISRSFSFDFENAGFMKEGMLFTIETKPKYEGERITLGDIIEENPVAERYFIPESRLYYTDPLVKKSDESVARLDETARRTWQYIKGGKRIPRISPDGHEYFFTEGSIPLIDEYNKPARTMLTSEGSVSRSTHLIRDKVTKRIRFLTPVEMERIQGFPDDWTKEVIYNDGIIEMPLNKRRFLMGNALVVNLIEQMEPVLSDIFDTNQMEEDSRGGLLQRQESGLYK